MFFQGLTWSSGHFWFTSPHLEVQPAVHCTTEPHIFINPRTKMPEFDVLCPQTVDSSEEKLPKEKKKSQAVTFNIFVSSYSLVLFYPLTKSSSRRFGEKQLLVGVKVFEQMSLLRQAVWKRLIRHST